MSAVVFGGEVYIGFWDTLTGKEVVDKVTEYSEVYGEVLLGLHRDFQVLRRTVLEYGEKFDAALAEVRRVSGDMRQLAAQVAWQADGVAGALVETQAVIPAVH